MILFGDEVLRQYSFDRGIIAFQYGGGGNRSASAKRPLLRLRRLDPSTVSLMLAVVSKT
jgi:hypothetical protein